MDQYLATYNEPQGVQGTDKYGNVVTNTNAMMATLHSSNTTTAKGEIRCMACHHAIVGEQVSEAMSFATGNYYDPLYERVGDNLTHWWGDNVNGDTFCVNENCHVYLRGSDGSVDRNKLEASNDLHELQPACPAPRRHRDGLHLLPQGTSCFSSRVHRLPRA